MSATARKTGSQSTPTRDQGRVLLITDDPAAVVSYKDALEGGGFSVVGVEGGAAAIVALSAVALADARWITRPAAPVLAWAVAATLRRGGFDRVVEPYRHGVKLGSNYLYLDWHVDIVAPKQAKGALDPWDTPTDPNPPTGVAGAN